MSLINICGYNYSGKGALMAILREYNQLKFFPQGSEFELFRMPGGLLDLHLNLTEYWSPLRADLSIRNYLRLVNVLARSKVKLTKPHLAFLAPGLDYEKLIPGFSEKSNFFIQSISTRGYRYWPYPDFYKYGPVMFINRIKSKIGFDKNYVYQCTLSDYELSKKIESYIKNLFNSHDFYILDNAIDPSLLNFSNHRWSWIKSIVVDRDPRSIYVDQVRNGVIDSSITSVKYFIDSYKKFREIYNQNNMNKNTLYVSFEKLLDSELEISKVCDFIGIENKPKSMHSNSDIKNLIKNKCLWRDGFFDEQLIYIEKSLELI